MYFHYAPIALIRASWATTVTVLPYLPCRLSFANQLPEATLTALDGSTGALYL